jgi:8-oxo-dGTP diphosphatase
MDESRLHIAVGVIFNKHKDKVLIAKRPEYVDQGGLWEFPGGKYQENENVEEALKRELFEELNLVVDKSFAMTRIEHDYTNRKVELNVWIVSEWHGDVYGKEGQVIEWVPVSTLSQRSFPDANSTIVESLILNNLSCSQE